MGYSARYHAASLAAVFLALAVGILIGVGFGDQLVSSTTKTLENSLTGDLQAARTRSDQLSAKLGRADQFASRVYPTLVNQRLAGSRVGVLAFGGLPQNLSANIEAALAPTGARLIGVGVVREPPDLSSLGSELQRTRFSDAATNPDTVEAMARGIGRQVILGGRLLGLVGPRLFSRASGRFGHLDDLIVVRQPPANEPSAERTSIARLESGLIAGAAAAGARTVGVERSDSTPSSITFFSSHRLSTVDDLDTVSGQLAMVFALLGAEGNFGVKSTADRLLPDLLAPAPAGSRQAGAGAAGSSAPGH